VKASNSLGESVSPTVAESESLGAEDEVIVMVGLMAEAIASVRVDGSVAVTKTARAMRSVMAVMHVVYAVPSAKVSSTVTLSAKAPRAVSGAIP
jgi:hypothetical protein